jgi:hypothetical protein
MRLVVANQLAAITVEANAARLLHQAIKSRRDD